MNTPALFLLDENGEAYDVLHFCDEDCQQFYQVATVLPVKRGVSNDWIPGTVCDMCGVALVC